MPSVADDRGQHVGEHRLHDRRSAGRSSVSSSRCFARAEALHRDDRRSRVHGGGSPAASALPARTRARARRAPGARRRPPSGSGTRGPRCPSGGGSGSPSSTTHRVDQPGVQRGDPGRGDRPADRGDEGVGRALDGPPGDERADRDDRRPRRLRSPRACPGRRGSGRSRSPGSRGRRRSARPPPAPPSDLRGRPRRRRSLELDLLDRRLAVVEDQELLQPAPAGRGAHPRADRLLAHRQHPGAHAERPRDLRLGGGQACRPRRGSGSGRGRWRGRGRRAGTSPARRAARAARGRRRCRRGCPSRAPRRSRPASQ